MGGAKKRAGLFVVDVNDKTCCVIRSIPYVYENGANGDRIPSLWSSVNGRTTAPVVADDESNGVIADGNGNGSGKMGCCGGDKMRSGSFLEMVQIPRGTRERFDASLMYTAIREFYEETLCANRRLYVYNEPFKLYWDDGGRRWTYHIYVALIKNEHLYFAFKPNHMTEIGETNVGRDAFAAKLSRSVNGSLNSIVVLGVDEYINYMRNSQLTHYGENNYNELFACIMRYMDSGRTTNVCEYAQHNVFTIIANSKEIYTKPYEWTAYTENSHNERLFRAWGGWWCQRLRGSPNYVSEAADEPCSNCTSPRLAVMEATTTTDTSS